MVDEAEKFFRQALALSPNHPRVSVSLAFFLADHGLKLDEALAQRHTVAEGVMTTHSARALAAREGIEMPIVSAVYRILFEHQPPRAAIGELMRRELRAEGDT